MVPLENRTEGESTPAAHAGGTLAQGSRLTTHIIVPIATLLGFALVTLSLGVYAAPASASHFLLAVVCAAAGVNTWLSGYRAGVLTGAATVVIAALVFQPEMHTPSFIVLLAYSALAALCVVAAGLARSRLWRAQATVATLEQRLVEETLRGESERVQRAADVREQERVQAELTATHARMSWILESITDAFYAL